MSSFRTAASGVNPAPTVPDAPRSAPDRLFWLRTAELRRDIYINSKLNREACRLERLLEEVASIIDSLDDHDAALAADYTRAGLPEYDHNGNPCDMNEYGYLRRELMDDMRGFGWAVTMALSVLDSHVIAVRDDEQDDEQDDEPAVIVVATDAVKGGA